MLILLTGHGFLKKDLFRVNQTEKAFHDCFPHLREEDIIFILQRSSGIPLYLGLGFEKIQDYGMLVLNKGLEVTKAQEPHC